jgi:hypothetical protein
MKVRKFNKENEHTSVKTSNFAKKNAHLIPQYTHHYEILPYTYNSIITMNGEIIDKQSYTNDSSKYKVIYNGNTTIVILEDGSKGIAKRNPKDEYDKFLGYKIAMKRAQIAKLQKELEELTK